MPREKQFDEAEAIRQLTEVFRRKGYNACSVGDLVAASGLSRSSLYDTFGDKEQLFVRCLGYYNDQLRERLEDATRNKAAALDKIEAALRMPFAAKAAEEACPGCLTVNTMSELGGTMDRVQEVVLANRAGYEDFLAACIKEGQKDGTIAHKDTPRVLATFLYTLFCGMLVANKALPDKAFINRNIKLAISLLKG